MADSTFAAQAKTAFQMFFSNFYLDLLDHTYLQFAGSA
jgi:hypothetical protein